MLEPKLEFKKLTADDIDWIMEYAHDYTSCKSLEDSFKYVNLSVATRVDGIVKSIIVMIVGEGKNYVTLLWTDGSYTAIKEAMVFFRNLSKTTRLLFHSKNGVMGRHRTVISGEKTGKPYYEMRY